MIAKPVEKIRIKKRRRRLITRRKRTAVASQQNAASLLRDLTDVQSVMSRNVPTEERRSVNCDLSSFTTQSQMEPVGSAAVVII